MARRAPGLSDFGLADMAAHAQGCHGSWGRLQVVGTVIEPGGAPSVNSRRSARRSRR